ncbi:fatty acid desaturase [Okeania hirsuta]|uniref:fatty acid desaturase n=1 Tax=Okeania hirsuta TaxID=1458930 RepID=UPI001374B8B2
MFWIPTLFISYNLGVIKILLLYWFIPYLFIFPVILYWNIIVNHYHTETGTRTVINPISNWITHNNGYHYIHHLFPNIPWYKLPKVHQELYPEGAEVTNNFFDSFKQLQSKSHESA